MRAFSLLTFLLIPLFTFAQEFEVSGESSPLKINVGREVYFSLSSHVRKYNLHKSGGDTTTPYEKEFSFLIQQAQRDVLRKVPQGCQVNLIRYEFKDLKATCENPEGYYGCHSIVHTIQVYADAVIACAERP